MIENKEKAKDAVHYKLTEEEKQKIKEQLGIDADSSIFDPKVD